MARLSTRILRHTRFTRQRSLTPELGCHAITPDTPLWHARQPQPYPRDPYWAIHWPGGQALTRLLLDQPHLVRDRRVLDLGCGGGTAAMAAIWGGASHVEANDVDPWALAATRLNFRRNRLSDERVVYSTRDRLAPDAPPPSNWQVLLVGDLYFDEGLGEAVSRLTTRWVDAAPDRLALIGDPGRWYLMDAARRTRARLHCMAKFELPETVVADHPGLTSGFVYRIAPHRQ